MSIGIGIGIGICVLLGGCGSDGDGGQASSVARPEHRLLVVGWDGATFDLLDGLAEAGRLPNFQALRERGSEAWLESTIVPISSAAWAAAITGKNPGKTGVYSFFEPVPGSYDVRLIDSRSNRATPLWRTLSRHGLESVVWGVPVTYPPEPIRGLLVAGMLAPFDAEYAHPRGTAERLRSKGFVPDLGMWRSNAPIRDPQAVAQQLAIKEREVLAALESVDWSLAWICFKSLDVLSHAQYDGRVDGNVAKLCERLDASLGALVAAVGEETNVMLVSDHGFRAYRKAFNVHTWLVESGYASMQTAAQRNQVGGPLAESRSEERRRFLAQLDLAQTTVFGTKAEGHFGGLRFNVQGREPQGALPAGAVDALYAKLRLELLALRGPDGRPVVTNVHRATELYPGPYAELLPDVLFETDPRYLVFSDKPSPRIVDLPQIFPDHDRRGVFVAAGPDIARRAAASERLEFSIADVAPTALTLLGMPVYDDLDGRARTEILASPRTVQTVSESTDPADSIGVLRFLTEDESLSQAEREELMRRMQALGYVE